MRLYRCRRPRRRVLWRAKATMPICTRNGTRITFRSGARCSSIFTRTPSMVRLLGPTLMRAGGWAVGRISPSTAMATLGQRGRFLPPFPGRSLSRLKGPGPMISGSASTTPRRRRLTRLAWLSPPPLRRPSSHRRRPFHLGRTRATPSRSRPPTAPRATAPLTCRLAFRSTLARV